MYILLRFFLIEIEFYMIVPCRDMETSGAIYLVSE